MASLYTRQANRKRLAMQAAGKLLREQEPNVYSLISPKGPERERKTAINQLVSKILVGRAGLDHLRHFNGLAQNEIGAKVNDLNASPNVTVSSAPTQSGLGPAASALYAEINAATNSEQLDGIASRLWPLWSAGQVRDEEAEFLSGAIEGRRPNAGARARAAGARVEPPRLNARIGSQFPPRQRPRSPDRQASRDRRRRLGGSSALPDTLRHHYTEGQRAVLCIIAGEVKARGACALPIDKIAALAGVCRTTVQTALQEARRLGHLKVTARPVAGRKNLPNLVEITSPEWCMWIKRGSPAHRPIGSIPANSVAPTKNPYTYKGTVERDRSRSEGLARGGACNGPTEEKRRTVSRY